jgi:hypothetical protein
MNAQPEAFLEPDSDDGTFRAEFPSTVQLMNGVYKREIQRMPPIHIATPQASFGEEFIGPWSHTTARISPPEPNAKDFGRWLERYRELVQDRGEEYGGTFVLSNSRLRKLSESNAITRMKRKNKAAIDLLQSWIEEEPDEQQAVNLVRLKETIDEQRSEDRKLFK